MMPMVKWAYGGEDSIQLSSRHSRTMLKFSFFSTQTLDLEAYRRRRKKENLAWVAGQI